MDLLRVHLGRWSIIDAGLMVTDYQSRLLLMYTEGSGQAGGNLKNMNCDCYYIFIDKIVWSDYRYYRVMYGVPRYYSRLSSWRTKLMKH